MKKLMLLLMIPALMVACKTTPEGQAEEEKEKRQAKNEEPARETKSEESRAECLPILPEKPLDYESQDYNFTTIDSIYFSNSFMFVAYNYSGCTEGQPTMALEEQGSGKRSMLLKMSLKVKDAGLCEMYMQRTSCFDLAEFTKMGNEFTIVVNNENPKYYRP